MKKQISNFVLAAAIIGTMAAGCSSSKNAGTSDTTKKDSAQTSTPAATPAATDTAKKDTTHH
jgi:hypothetical protein